MTHCSRKRPRSCDEECCELMPISKRINDLHIRSGTCQDSSSAMNNMQEIHPRLRNAREMNMYELQRQSFEAKNNAMECGYSPELNAIQNPYYYHVNEVLYAAHIQRLQRVGKPNI